MIKALIITAGLITIIVYLILSIKDDKKIKQKQNEYMKQGLSKKEARKQAKIDIHTKTIDPTDEIIDE